MDLAVCKLKGVRTNLDWCSIGKGACIPPGAILVDRVPGAILVDRVPVGGWVDTGERQTGQYVDDGGHDVKLLK